MSASHAWALSGIDEATLEGVKSATGVAVDLDASGLPTIESLKLLAGSGALGKTLAARLVGEVSHAFGSDESRASSAYDLEDTFNGWLSDSHIEQAEDSQRTREEIYHELLPFDHDGSPSGQKYAKWIKERLDLYPIEHNGKAVPPRYGRGIPMAQGESHIAELPNIIQGATDTEIAEIFHGMSRQDALRAITDPHLVPLFTAMGRIVSPHLRINQGEVQGDIRDFVRLRHYVESFPQSFGGFKELLIAEMNRVKDWYIEHEAGGNPEAITLFEGEKGAVEYETYQGYWDKQQGNVGGSVSNAVSRFFRSLFGGG